ncbi:MAG: regulator of sigma protease [Patescibacteria group bacterium]|nr:regulator of sigma protease [Patescibacteria group bacterium]
MFLIDLIVFFLILGIVILVHEFGHFIAAKKTGVPVNEFGIGFPPKIWKKKKGETEYFIGAIPFGGLCALDGEDDEKESIYDSKKTWQKIWICGGGIIMNILFASLLFYFLIGFSGFNFTQGLMFEEYEFPFGSQSNYPAIVSIQDNSPAYNSELEEGDYIVSINGEKFDNFQSIIDENKGNEIILNTDSGKEVKITPRVDYPEGEGPLGVGLRNIAIVDYSGIEKPLVGFLHSYNIMDYSFSAIGDMFSYAFENNSPEIVGQSLAGPVGIFAITKITLSQGFYEVINLIAVLSIAVGITNLLPIPAMDGAKIIFTFLERINKRIFSKKLQVRIESYGFVFLILLAFVLIIKDFIQFKDIIFK